MTTLPVPDIATDEDSGPITAEGLLRRRRVRGDASCRRWPQLLIRGPVVPEVKTGGPAARDENGFVATGLRGETIGPDCLGVLRDPELIYHGGFTVAPCKFPDKLLVVKGIPRDRSGRILRGEILRQV